MLRLRVYVMAYITSVIAVGCISEPVQIVSCPRNRDAEGGLQDALPDEAGEEDTGASDGPITDGDSGDDPAKFCDDHNPCTDDANCTPCYLLPREYQNIFTCTDEREIPPFCNGLLGCAHFARSTPVGQVDDCFPVSVYVDDSGLHSGVCVTGVCVNNP